MRQSLAAAAPEPIKAAPFRARRTAHQYAADKGKVGGHDAPPVTIGTDPTDTHARQDRERRTA